MTKVQSYIKFLELIFFNQTPKKFRFNFFVVDLSKKKTFLLSFLINNYNYIFCNEFVAFNETNLIYLSIK